MSRFKIRRPSPALVVAVVALCVAMGGSAVAATGLIHTANIANGAVTNNKIANGAVGLAKLNQRVRVALASAGTARGIVTGPQGAKGAGGPQGQQGQQGQQGPQGQGGKDGKDGLNPAVPVVDVPAIAASSGKNPNPDSGDAGDGGWYFSGNGAGGSASLNNGQLELTGSGVDSNTIQGGIGIAKAFNNVPLGNLNELSYQWHVDQVNGGQAPNVHITVTGMTTNSKYGPGCAKPPCTGFANLDYNPAINGITPSQGVLYQADGFAPNAKWFSTTNPNISNPGGQNAPETLATFVTDNPNAVITQISLDNGGSSNGSGSFYAGAHSLILGFAGSPFTRYGFGG